jgi:hypothetical protein
MAHATPNDSRPKTNPDAAKPAGDTSPQACAADGGRPGPAREGGGTTGGGNLSEGQADRTGGATAGVPDAGARVAETRRGVPPDA